MYVFTAQCTPVQSAVLRSHVVHPTVCPSGSLVDCDHIGWKSWKLIAQTISLRSLYPKGDPPDPRGTWGNFGETINGVGKKWRSMETKSGNISKTRKDR